MPVTWCYQVSVTDASKYFCSTGFPVGCYVDSQGTKKDACVIQVRKYFIKSCLRLSMGFFHGTLNCKLYIAGNQIL